MGIRWKTFEMPKRLELEQTTATPTYGRFIAEPFERGFGHTIGNSLRRVLISSIEGAAVANLRIEDAQHEFATINGVVEDVAQIVLNIKKLVMISHSRQAKTITIDVKKKGEVTAADIQHDDTIEIINKDLLIATLSKDVKFHVEMEVVKGRGYVPAERNKKENNPIGSIPLDTAFSPVVKVNYFVEETRVGQMTDYDKLFVEVWTNGAMNPEEAMLYASNILQRHFDIFVNYGELPEEEEEEVEEEDTEFKDLLDKPITELELSVRSSNCLEAADIKTIGDLVSKTESTMLKFKNFGKKSLTEINAILSQMGLSLGMDIEARLMRKKKNEA
jgi:DNA-directed RNA polymerase subunit alpha